MEGRERIDERIEWEGEHLRDARREGDSEAETWHLARLDLLLEIALEIDARDF
jgi:hypothetical protein